MNKTFEFKHARFSVKTRFASRVLFERMKFANVETTGIF